MASTNKFAFQAPNPQALDPNTLEQIYAQGAARRLGPAFNLAAQGLARGDRQDSASAYLASIGDLNRRAQEAGRMQLEHERLLELTKLGSDLAGKDMTFAGTPLAQFALTMGQGGSADLLQALMQTGALNSAARRIEQLGKGYGDLAAQGMRITGSIPSADAIPFTPMTQGLSTAERAAATTSAGFNKPRTEFIQGPNGEITRKDIVPFDPSNPYNPSEQAVQTAQTSHAAEATRIFGSDGAKFVAALYNSNVSIPNGSRFKSATGNVNGRLIENFPTVVLPNGTTYGFVDGRVERLQTPPTTKK